MHEGALLPEHVRFWVSTVQTGETLKRETDSSGLKPLLPVAAAARTLTGFFFTCWVAARLGEEGKSAALN